jgi:hypothetical protein
MIAKIVHILCEGQTEQGFVNEVLKPYLLDNGCTAVKSVMVTTNKKKNVRGGLVSYPHASDDLRIMLASNKDGASERHVVTTMFDLYALPTDFPGYTDSIAVADRYERVASIETAFAADINSDRFIPYIQLHEFEALVFCGLDYLTEMYNGTEKSVGKLREELEAVGNPELVNDNPQTAPSKRIINAIEGNRNKRFNYDKPKTGKFVTQKVGIDNLCSKCRHFNDWIQKLIDY